MSWQCTSFCNHCLQSWRKWIPPQCSRRWLNAISPPASHGSALMCWNATGVPAQMPVKSMWKLRSELRKRWNVDWAAEEWKGGRTEDFGEGVAACRHSPHLSHFGQIPHTRCRRLAYAGSTGTAPSTKRRAARRAAERACGGDTAGRATAARVTEEQPTQRRCNWVID